MTRAPPISTLTDKLFPYLTLFRDMGGARVSAAHPGAQDADVRDVDGRAPVRRRLARATVLSGLPSEGNRTIAEDWAARCRWSLLLLFAGHNQRKQSRALAGRTTAARGDRKCVV